MSTLFPCPGCARHVRRHERVCPFCELALSFADLPEPTLPTRRIGRGAMMAFASLLASGCAVSHVTDAGADDAGMDARVLGGADAAYGGAPSDARWMGGADAAYGGAPDAGRDAPLGGCDCGMYGGPPDAGHDGS
jgi:hypothetical protein